MKRPNLVTVKNRLLLLALGLALSLGASAQGGLVERGVLRGVFPVTPGGSYAAPGPDTPAYQKDGRWQALQRQDAALRKAMDRNREEANLLRKKAGMGIATAQESLRLQQLDIYYSNQQRALLATNQGMENIKTDYDLRDLKSRPQSVSSR